MLVEVCKKWTKVDKAASKNHPQSQKLVLEISTVKILEYLFHKYSQIQV